jgi:aminoglycoside phosphotransferase (APT) family kinase protein
LARDLSVSASRPRSGLSSDTFFVEVSFDDDRGHRHHRYVVRLPRAEAAVFPDYDLARQVRVQRALHATAVPVVHPVVHELDERWLRSPFVVMPRVAGRVLSNRAQLTEGWLHDATPLERRSLFKHFIETLAHIHRLAWPELDLGPLSGGGPELAGMLDWWGAYLQWAGGDGDGEHPGPYGQGLEWCRVNLPDPPSPSLLWGDPQLANAVFADDMRPVAILDWEMAALGPPEIDLAWFLTLRELTVETAGADLDGLPSRDQVLEWYQDALGRSVADLRWYEVFAHVRSGAILLRVARLHGVSSVDPGGSWALEAPQAAAIRRLTAEPRPH